MLGSTGLTDAEHIHARDGGKFLNALGILEKVQDIDSCENPSQLVLSTVY